MYSWKERFWFVKSERGHIFLLKDAKSRRRKKKKRGLGEVWRLWKIIERLKKDAFSPGIQGQPAWILSLLEALYCTVQEMDAFLFLLSTCPLSSSSPLSSVPTHLYFSLEGGGGGGREGGSAVDGELKFFRRASVARPTKLIKYCWKIQTFTN